MNNPTSILNRRDVQVYIYRMSTDAFNNEDAFKDPFEYEDPTKSYFWENRGARDWYRAEFRKASESLIGKITEIVDGDVSSLKDQSLETQTSSLLPIYQYDVSPYILRISNFIYDLEFNNSLQVEIEIDEKMRKTVFSENEVTVSKPFTRVQENDILELRISFDEKEPKYKTVFLGFISNISDTTTYGSIRKASFYANGIQKLMGLTKVIERPAIADFMITNYELTKELPTGYGTQFQHLDVNEVCNKIFTNALSYKSDLFEVFDKAVNVGFDTPKAELTLKALANTSGDKYPNILYKLEEKMKIKRTSLLDSKTKEADALKLQIEISYIKTTISLMNKLPEEGRVSLDKQGVMEAINKMAKEEQANVATGRAIIQSGKKAVYRFDTDRLKEPQDYRTSFLLLYGFYKVRQLLKKLIGNTKGQIIFNDISDFEDMAIIEEGHHKTYNEHTMDVFEKFYTQLRTPLSILEDIRTTLYYDVFADRLGKIIVRPPRYNNIITDDSHVIEQTDILNQEIIRQDLSLKSHADTKWMLPFIGVYDFPSGSFTDFNVFFKYGFRADAPLSSPAVTNADLGGMYSALSLNIKNAMTRTLTIKTIKKEVNVGELYILKMGINLSDGSSGGDGDIIAYASRVETVIEYGQAMYHNVTFIYARMLKKVVATQELRYDFGKLYAPYIMSSGRIKLLTDSGYIQEQNGVYTVKDAPINANLSEETKKKLAETKEIVAERLDKSSLAISGIDPQDERYTLPTFTPYFLEEGERNKGFQSGQPGIFIGDRVLVMKRLPSILDLQFIMDENPNIKTRTVGGIGGINSDVIATEAYQEDDYFWVEETEISSLLSKRNSNGELRNPDDAYIFEEMQSVYQENFPPKLGILPPPAGSNQATGEMFVQENLQGDTLLDGPLNELETKGYANRVGVGNPERRYMIYVSDPMTNLFRVRTPFRPSSFAYGNVYPNILTKKMIKSMFVIDMEMKKRYFMIHHMDDTIYTNKTPTFDEFRAWYARKKTNDSDNRPTMLQLKISALNLGDKEKPMTFRNNYFSVTTQQDSTGKYLPFPAGTVYMFGAILDKVEQSYSFGSFSSLVMSYITGPGGPELLIYDTYKSLIDPVIRTFVPNAGIYDVAKRVYFSSPYFEMNIERYLSEGMRWVVRGNVPAGAYQQEASKVSNVDEPHANGRAIDILLNDEETPDGKDALIPGVYSSNYKAFSIVPPNGNNPDVASDNKQIYAKASDVTEIYPFSGTTFKYAHVQVNPTFARGQRQASTDVDRNIREQEIANAKAELKGGYNPNQKTVSGFQQQNAIR